ncbi:MAG: hypothetical protein WCQ99_09250 [Pseudomonadota bacterium]
MEISIKERDTALQLLEEQKYSLSVIYRESYLNKGRGSLIVHTYLLEIGHQLSVLDFRNRHESIELFDNKKSRRELTEMIDGYDPKREGILVLITKSNATWFATFKLASRRL